MSLRIWVLEFVVIVQIIVTCGMACSVCAATAPDDNLLKDLRGADRALNVCDLLSARFRDGSINKYLPEKRDIDPRGTEYLDLDIDGDGLMDKVTYSSGSSESHLAVKLTSGSEYALEQPGAMQVLSINERIYAVVTYWSSGTMGIGKVTSRSAYVLTNNGAKYNCQF